ncbi:PAS domain S-box protein [Rhodohalobacter sp.]|uniref:PAS domain S-box protein n=1 Tax=Rhodohalobacter sp. TaxID=1974210 RepID=UPI002ACED2C7|nr:PAS domain S-box protein [Rhodohalobacter sp.]
MDHKPLFQHLPLPAIVLDAKSADFTIVEINQSFQDVYSKPISTALNKPFFDAFPMDQDGAEGKKQLRSFRKVIETGEPDKTGTLKINEGDVHNKFKDTKFYELQNIPIKNDNDDVEFIVHTIRDITKEKHKTRQLEKSEKRFRSLVENGSDVLFVLDRDGSPKYVSPNIAYVLGYSVEQAMEFKPENILHPHDIPHVMKEIEVALSNPAMPISVTPARMRHKNGSWRWMAGTITNMLHDPAINGIVDNFRDITEKVEAEKRLKESNEKFQSLIQSIDGIFWEAEAETFKFSYISPQVEEILGYTPEDWLKEDRFWQNKIHPEDRENTIQFCHNETKEGRNHEVEYRIQKADGSYIWVRDVVTVVAEDGKPKKLRGLILDITEKKILQQNLEEAYKLSNIGTWELDLINHTLTWSKYVKELHEVDPNFEPNLESAINFYEEGYSRDKVSEAVGKAVEDKIPFDIELTIITAKGNRKWIRAVGEPKIVNGETVAVIGSTQDITNRKQAEISKEEARRSLQNILDQSMDVICVIDEDGRFELVSSAAKQVWGYEPEELEGKQFINFVIPEDREITRQTADDVMSGVDQTNFENRYRHKNGKIIPIVWAARWSKTDQKMYAIARDARELKEAQGKLEETEQHLRNIVEHSTNLFYTHDVEGNLTYVSPQSYDFFGYSPEESKRKWEDFVTDHPDNRAVYEHTERAIKSGKPQPPYEFQIEKADGEKIWVEANEAPIVKNGETVAVVGSLTDITDRKHYQQELKKSLERYNYVSKASRDAIYDWNIIDNDQHWGVGFKSLFGFDTQKMNETSDSWENILHPGDKDTILDKMHHTLYETEKSEFSAEYRLEKATGEYAYVSDIGYIIRDEEGEPIRMIGAIRDITESKAVEIEKTIQNNLSQIFTKNIGLKDILSDSLEYLADFGDFNTSEVWLLSQTQTHLNLYSTFAKDENGSRFYKESSDIKKFLHGEGLPGMVWKQQENLFWDNISESDKYLRFEVAAKAGLKSAYGILLTHNENFVGVLLLSSDQTTEGTAKLNTADLFFG